MISILNLILIFFWLVVIPFILGSFIESEFVTRCQMSLNKMISRTFVFGFAFMLAVFQLVAVPLIFIGTSFTALFSIFTAIIIICATVSVCTAFYNKKLNAKINNSTSAGRKPRRSYWFRYKVRSFFGGNDREAFLIWIAAICVIIFQTALLVFRQHIDADDARFLAEALDAYEKDSLLRIHPINGLALKFPIGEMQKDVTSPYPLLIAVLAKLTMMHPTVLAHSVLPVLLIPLSYAAVYIIARYFFDDRRSSGMFLLVFSLIVLFSFESVFSIGYTLLTIIWQGRSIFMTVLLPALFYLCMQIYTEGVRNRYIYLVLLMCMLASADLSGTGTILSVCLLAVFAFCELVFNKKVRSAVRIGLVIIPNIAFFALYKVLMYIFMTYSDRFT